MTQEPYEQSQEMRAVLRLEKMLRKHIKDDDERFDRIESQLQAVKVRLSVLIPLVIGSAVAAYFGAHG